jgi:hypothetical protein
MCLKFDGSVPTKNGIQFNINPPLSCPVKPGNYTLQDSTFDLSALAMLPLEGYLWVTTFKLTTIDKATKARQTVLCLKTETKVLKTSRKL